MASKSPDAFRTISEVAEWLNTPAHVLRFWESKFSQVKPVKRAGGRRYYRPSDMALIGGIKKLLHDDGMTIKGAQKLLREQGIKHVAAMSPPMDEDLEGFIEPALSQPATAPAPTPKEEASGQVLSFSSRQDKPAEATPAAPTPDPLPETARVPETPDMFGDIDAEGENLFSDNDGPEVADSAFHEDHIEESAAVPAEPAAGAPKPAVPEPAEPESVEPEPETAPAAAALPTFMKRPVVDTPEPQSPAKAEPASEAAETPTVDAKASDAPEEPKSEVPEPTTNDSTPEAEAPSEPQPDAPTQPPKAADPAPKVVETPPDPLDHSVSANAGQLTNLVRRSPDFRANPDEVEALLKRLQVHADGLDAAARN